MALLIMILRKMIKNKWLELSLLFGLVLSVALTSSMPIYTDAILHRLLIKELENLQIHSGQYPGTYWSAVTIQPDAVQAHQGDNVIAADEFLQNQAGGRFGIPVQYFVRERVTDKISFAPAQAEQVDVTNMRWADLAAISDLQNHVRLVDGRFPAQEPDAEGVYEALVVPEALTEFNMVLGSVFTVTDTNVETAISVKPVGVIEPTDYSELYWYNHPGSYKSSFLLDLELFDREFTTGGKLPVKSSYWYFALDYTQMTLASVGDFLAANRSIESRLDGYFDNRSSNAPALTTLNIYQEKESRLRLLLWSLNVPVMLMLAFYLYMVANLITERQKTEIAVLRSRGASRWQIIAGYALEGTILGGIAFLAGPYVGVLLTKGLGASSGFLEFVQRAQVQASVNQEAFHYALIAVAASIIMTLIPAVLATRATIVGHKQQMARQGKASFWHKYFIDVLLIAVSLYGLQNYHSRMKDWLSLGYSSADLRIDPLLFLIPSFFILGTGLFVLRLYPWFIRMVYWAGKRWWPPSLYSTLIQVGRSTSQYQFIMVFMIITIAIGVFSASANRTINSNLADNLYYNIGTDITMRIHWESNAPPILLSSTAEGGSNASATPFKTQYTEPSFLPFSQLPGVEHAAKVYVNRNAAYYPGADQNEKTAVQLMGIDTYDFGHTAWMRNGLLDHHFHQYLNLIASTPSAILISRTMAQEHGLSPGDTVRLGWESTEAAEFIVHAVIDYWPSWNPNASAPGSTSGNPSAGTKPMLVVGNLSYIQNNLALEPYEVWLKLQPDADSQEVYQAVADHGYDILSLKNGRQERIQAINDPFLLAINGVMTLDFLISIGITLFGFLLYWIISLFARTLQFGIFRAMGVSFRRLLVMLVGEQLLISGAAIVIGVLTGSAASRLFVPLFEMSFDTKAQVLPFKVIFDPNDQLRLYWIVTVMIVFGLAVLGYIVSRIKIHQAVKLGED